MIVHFLETLRGMDTSRGIKSPFTQEKKAESTQGKLYFLSREPLFAKGKFSYVKPKNFLVLKCMEISFLKRI